MNATEAKLVAYWTAVTPPIPGNSIPGFTRFAERAPESALRETYREMFRKVAPAGYSREDLVRVLTTLNVAIEAADARCGK